MTTHPESLWLAVRGAFRGGLTLGEVQEAEDELNRLTRERDALLEALNLAADFLEHATEFRIGHPGFEQAHAKARAAVKAVEEGK